MGVSIVFSIEARLHRGDSRANLRGTRCGARPFCFCFGIVVNGFPYFHLDHLRFYGVLQRIADLLPGCEPVLPVGSPRVDQGQRFSFACSIGYWILVRWVPVPGAGVPGRDIPFLDKNQNIVAWLDRQLMPGHLYEDWATHNARDPEGLLSDIPALDTTLIGLLAALWLRQRETKR